MCAALTDRIGYDAETEGGKTILEGTCFPLWVHQSTYKSFRSPTHASTSGTSRTNIHSHLHSRAHLRLEKQKKRTASYQGELNFNDFKDGSQDKYIAQLDCLSRQIPLARDFAPESYKPITDFQILK